jgi:hypothetical protein
MASGNPNQESSFKDIAGNHENTCQDFVSGQPGSGNRRSLLEAFHFRRSGPDPEPMNSFWTPAFARMTPPIPANIYAIF